MKNTAMKILISFVSILLVVGILSSSYANDVNSIHLSRNELQKYLSDTTNIKAEEVVTMYTELSEQYSNKEIANMVEENKSKIIEKSGIDEKSLDTGTTILRSLDTEETKRILKEDLNIEEIQAKLDAGYSIREVVKEMQEQMTTSYKVSLATKILWASSIVKTAIVILAVLKVYNIMVRWIIFRKANKHGWAAIVPIYNQITYLKVCNISPWWILILFIPVIGWIIYGIVKIFARFTLAEAFNKGTAFGFGLLILGIVFRSIIAFNRNIKYVEYED